MSDQPQPERRIAADRPLLELALAALRNGGIDIAAPWEGDLDDLERERFDAVAAAVRAIREAIRSTDMTNRTDPQRFGAACGALKAGDEYAPWREEILEALRMAAAVETPGLIERSVPSRFSRNPTDQEIADAIREAIRKGAQPPASQSRP